MKRYIINSGKARLRNGTILGGSDLWVDVSPYVPVPWSELRPLIAFAFRYARNVAIRSMRDQYRTLPGVIKLELTKGNGWRGRAWSHSKCVLVRIGSLNVKPFKSTYPRFKDMPEFWIVDWRERLIGLVTHELWHIYHPGSGRDFEYDCELMEWDSTEAWRKHKGYTFTPPAEPEPQDLLSDLAALNTLIAQPA